MVLSHDTLLVFTDLDGSLLDHDNYDWQSAAPWLDRLRDKAIPVIINTSKTRAEVATLRQELDLYAPYIVENGSAVILPPEWCLNEAVDDSGWAVVHLGADYARIRDVLEAVRSQERLSFRGFGDMTLQEVVERTGLDEQAAERARDRQGSEPIVWEDTPDQLTHFQQLLAGTGLSLTRGGRFHHVLGEEVNKGAAARWLCERHEAIFEQSVRSIALGDGENDVSMLKACDRAVAIRNDHGRVLEVEGAYMTQHSGPAGWAEGLDHWLGHDKEAD
ncbi:HAD-IIB family hydrolase [Larsenimonas salina]|uniref:HAD-IIB family hydrolase n=1 Tax=Larsenimonas salina TaxID=1295565 RepID=UPI002072A501|nr:HAD-IIB family hydrolase [Larsenimonas salina]MCM5704913.1 HAD-IIB family hydrolase [Larsenimonas salina]